MEWLKNNWKNLLAIASFLVGITGVVLFFLGKEKVNLYYETTSVPIISKSQKSFRPLSKNLKINYLNTKVDNLTVTEVKFYNKGNKALSGNDISATVPISFEINDNYKILDYLIDENLTSKESGFKLETLKKKNKIKINFKYMNPENTLTFRVLHTGNSDSIKAFNGNGLGFSKIKNYLEEKCKKNKMWKILNYSIIAILYIFYGIITYKKMKNKGYIAMPGLFFNRLRVKENGDDQEEEENVST